MLKRKEPTMKIFKRRLAILLRGKRFHVKTMDYVYYNGSIRHFYTLVDRWKKREIFPESDLPAVHGGARDRLNDLHWNGDDDPIASLHDEYWIRAGLHSTYENRNL